MNTGTLEDPARRALLRKAALLALAPSILPACGKPPGSAADAAPFSASFQVPRQGRVHLEFQDEAAFCIAPDIGPGRTIAVDGEIYLHLAPSITSVNRPRLLWVGTLAPVAPEPVPIRVNLTPAELPSDGGGAWRVDAPVFRADWPRNAGPQAQPAGDWWVASVPSLARAQRAVGVRLRDGMDMGLCGDVVTRLLATWPEALTRNGLAVLAHSSGVQLAGPIGPLAHRISLPDGIQVEDFRLRKV